VERWHQDYSNCAGMTGDRVDNPLCTDDAEYRKAKAQGAAGILIFRPGDGSKEKIRIKLTEYQ